MAKNISATELKNKTSEILNLVYFGKTTAIIEKHGKPIAKIVPVEKNTKDKNKLDKIWNHYFGILPDFPDVTKDRRSRKRKWSF